MTDFWKEYDNDIAPTRYLRLKKLLFYNHIKDLSNQEQYMILTELDSYFEDAIQYGKELK